ncbi:MULTISPECIES: carbon storage regulator CsrA [Paenibacillus]|uniref:carbon storage regulator CsrA n=1 Tax=Paenibacillus TaxID=44249 RepID=UPI00096DB0EB|nr:carbon storage regulator CsrA [Paenibacillus odorifer]OME56485.1 carbon storage regulator [Paenibacillus odorifer]OME61874.1 carbon storage regulator [Paenibacillus odorifer]
MLVLTRKKGESIIIQNDIIVTVLSIEGDVMKIGISAPRNVDIYRKEIFDAIEQNNQSAVMDPEAIEKAMLEMDK